jgi:hypothetical protein
MLRVSVAEWVAEVLSVVVIVSRWLEHPIKPRLRHPADMIK